MNESEHDRRLDAAWSAASRDEPPPALDTAIRAAARRAVGGAPGSRRSKHWWYPLAAAATVALLAVGIAQLTPPERVAPASVADTADAQREALADGTPQTAAVEPPLAGPPGVPTAVPAGEEQRVAKPAPGAAAGTRAGERARVAGAARQEPAVVTQAPASPPNPVAGATTDLAAANTAPRATAPAPASPRAEPFPAAAPVELHREGSLEERSPVENAPAAARVEPVPAPSRALGARMAHADAAKTADASARSVEEWIKRIHDLKSEGRLEEAAKELTMFRSAYGERADALLPADLREIKR
jgi:hypothetical protein